MELDTGDPWEHVGQEPSGRAAREARLHDEALIRAGGIRAVNLAFTELYEFLTSEDHPGRSLAPSIVPPQGSMEAWLQRFWDISRYTSPFPPSSTTSPEELLLANSSGTSETAAPQDACTPPSTSSDSLPADGAEGFDEQERKLWDADNNGQGESSRRHQGAADLKRNASDRGSRGKEGGGDRPEEEWVADIGGAEDVYTEAYRDTAPVVPYPLDGTVNWRAVDAIWQRPELVLTSSLKQRMEA